MLAKVHQRIVQIMNRRPVTDLLITHFGLPHFRTCRDTRNIL